MGWKGSEHIKHAHTGVFQPIRVHQYGDVTECIQRKITIKRKKKITVHCTDIHNIGFPPRVILPNSTFSVHILVGVNVIFIVGFVSVISR